ncbi:Myb-like DNA-binding domain containing protein [Histomonas meleagridis]|uniref:Myb-like DNA-binding domain containing protein n=1 Tax=Histomonas meleagridis TaxID=135588 RepID=UPI0035598547|nr:Myb-like DNA-binding domain containing protein [Histomonas meleagridis]KAH0800578.1 Myb-like DNA-binding domain containing protein [Histomonas meleagridis]
MSKQIPPRTKFTQLEDNKLIKILNNMSKVNWKAVAKQMEGRTPRQCRERYNNYLSPNIRNSPWTPEEDAILIQKYREFGPKWSFLAQFFDKRGPVSLKNRHAKLIYQSSKQKNIVTTQKELVLPIFKEKIFNDDFDFANDFFIDPFGDADDDFTSFIDF